MHAYLCFAFFSFCVCWCTFEKCKENTSNVDADWGDAALAGNVSKFTTLPQSRG